MEANTDGPLRIGVWSGNDKAQRLYAAYGFEKVGEYDYPVGRARPRVHLAARSIQVHIPSMLLPFFTALRDAKVPVSMKPNGSI